MSSKAARRYAYAYHETALENKILETVKDDVELISNTLESSKELRVFLKSPLVNKDQKQAALLEIFEKKVQPLTIQLMKILTEKSRESLLGMILNHFTDYYNVHHGIVEIDITSAFELDNDQVSNLIKQLEIKTGKKIELNRMVDSDLLGGMMVRIDDTVIDGSVKHKLSQLKNRLTSTAVE